MINNKTRFELFCLAFVMIGMLLLLLAKCSPLFDIKEVYSYGGFLMGGGILWYGLIQIKFIMKHLIYEEEEELK